MTNQPELSNTHYQNKLKLNIILFFIVQFITGLLFSYPIWVAFQKRFLSYSQMSLLESMVFAITLLLQLPTGAFADMFGRKKSIFVGWLISAVGYGYMAFTASAFMLVISQIIIAIGTAFVSGADIAFLYDTLKELKRENEFAKLNARGILIFRTSMVIAMVFGGYLYQIFFGLPYILRSIGFVVSIIIVLFMLEPPIRKHEFTIKSYFNKMKDGISELFKTSHTKKLTVYYVLIAGITTACIWYYNNTFAKDVGFTEVEQGWIFSIIYILTTVALLWIAEKKQTMKKDVTYILLPIILTISLIGGYFASKTTAFFMLNGVILVGGARYTLLDGYINKEFSSHHRATALSALNMIISIFFIILLFINGPLQDMFSTKLIFTLLGILTGIIAIPITIVLVKEHKKRFFTV